MQKEKTTIPAEPKKKYVDHVHNERERERVHRLNDVIYQIGAQIGYDKTCIKRQILEGALHRLKETKDAHNMIKSMQFELDTNRKEIELLKRKLASNAPRQVEPATMMHPPISNNHPAPQITFNNLTQQMSQWQNTPQAPAQHVLTASSQANTEAFQRFHQHALSSNPNGLNLNPNCLINSSIAPFPPVRMESRFDLMSSLRKRSFHPAFTVPHPPVKVPKLEVIETIDAFQNDRQSNM